MNQLIGSNIRRYRKQRGLTQRELSDLMQYRQHTSIGRIEQGCTDLPVSQLVKIAGILKVSILDLLGQSSSDCSEFLPYLQKADEGTLNNIRKMLDMPLKEAKTPNLNSTNKVG